MKAAKAEGAIICADTKMPTYREISREDLLEIRSVHRLFLPE